MVDEVVLATGGSDEWETPQDLFDQLNEEFMFTLDPCATAANATCDRFFSLAEDGLRQPWTRERAFVNPPFGERGCLLPFWADKCHASAIIGRSLSVLLVPARTDTAWWHGPCAAASERRFIKGRLSFLREGRLLDPAPFPSALVIFRPPPKPYFWING